MKLLLCGDTVPTAANAELFRRGDTQTLFGDVLDVFRANDRVIVNLECALTDFEGKIRKFGPNLRGPRQSARTLRAAGVTDCALANNHILDFGVRGLHDTERELTQAGLGWFGAGENAEEACRPYIIGAEGKRIAILNYNEHEYTYALDDQAGAAPFDACRAMVQVARAKAEADYLIVLYHGGKEYSEYPSPRLHDACHAMVDLGADAVLCQHSHIIGCSEVYNGRLILYGQGNFHFVKYDDRPFWQRGLMVQMEIGDGIRSEFIPVVAGEKGISLAAGAEKDAMLRGFAECSARLADGTWRKGWEQFVAANSEGYLNCVRNALKDDTEPRYRQNMAHYLDCEAHLDMLTEIFASWHRKKEDGAMTQDNPFAQHAAMMQKAERRLRYVPGTDFAAWQAEARAKLGELLGLDRFSACGDALRIESETKGALADGTAYTEYRMHYATEENFESVAHLLIPDGAKQPVPVVICLQGHSKGMHISLGRPKYPGDEVSINGGDRDFAPQILREGYAALALEQRGFGECGGNENGPQCTQPAMDALLLGRTLIGERVWDISRTIDVLAKYFPQLDMRRVALMGNSGGGTATIYAAAMDERIAAAMPSCAFCGYRESIGLQRHCVCNYIPDIMRWFDMGDLGGLIAPRPLVVVNALKDSIFPVESAKREFDVTKECYTAAGVPKLCTHVIGMEGHRFYAALGWPVFEKLTGWQKG